MTTEERSDNDSSVEVFMVEDTPQLKILAWVKCLRSGVIHRIAPATSGHRPCLWMLTLALSVSASVSAQPAPVTEASPLPAQLESQRAIILNPDDSMETRVGQAVAMLTDPSKQAVDVAVNLLSTGEVPSTKIVLCRAIQRVGQAPSTTLDPRLIDPLLLLLDHASTEVITAASRALSWFQDAKVFDALRQIVDQREAPKTKRLGALAALSRNTDRRDVIAKLILLLDTTESDFRPEVLRALGNVGVPQDETVESWKIWWKDQASLTEPQWLRRQLNMKSKRLAVLDTELEQTRSSGRSRQEQLSNRLGDALSAQYRLTPADQKDALLIGWFQDSIPDVRSVAAKLVAEQISEGNLPTDELRQALRSRFNDASPVVRKTAIEIVGALNDPDDAQPMLTRLGNETDSGVRETILSMLGKLRNPDAIDPLIEEITKQDTPEGCVAAASDALGMLATRDILNEQHIQASIEPLRTRFASANGASNRLKVALLGAMAAIGSTEFRPEFEANLGASDPELLLRAIRGVTLVGHNGQLSRLSELTTHSDDRVRQRAIAALGALGSIDQLQTVATRLDSGNEKVEGPRQHAWLAFTSITSRLSLQERMSVIEMLANYPNLRAEYLTNIEEELLKVDPPHPSLTAIQARLAETYIKLGRNVEALPYLRRLYGHAEAQERSDIALKLLRCSLLSDKTDGVDELLKTLAGGSVDTVDTVQRVAIEYIDRLASAERLDDLRSLSQLLRGTSLEAYPRLRTHLDSIVIPDASTNGLKGDVSGS